MHTAASGAEECITMDEVTIRWRKMAMSMAVSLWESCFSLSRLRVRSKIPGRRLSAPRRLHLNAESPQSKILVDSTLRERGRGAILPCPTLLACSTLRLFFAFSHPCRSWTICSTTLRQQTPITTCKTAPVPPSHHQSSHQLSQSRSVVHNTNPTTRTSTSTRQHEQRAIL